MKGGGTEGDMLPAWLEAVAFWGVQSAGDEGALGAEDLFCGPNDDVVGVGVGLVAGVGGFWCWCGGVVVFVFGGVV